MNNPQINDRKMVFLIGAARSGTKFLRDLLAESDAASCVPFDVNYVWRFRNESRPDDVIPPEAASQELASFISRTLTSMARKASGESKSIVIEKTVSNVFRVPFIFRLFPDAKFIHLVRDGRDVSLSAARQWEAPSNMSYLLDKIRYFPIRNWAYGIWFLRNTLRNRAGTKRKSRMWGPRYPGIDQDIGNFTTLENAAKQWSESILAADNGLASVPPNQKFVVHYENLVSDPQYLKELINFLELPDAEKIIGHYDRRVSRDKGGDWHQLSKEDRSSLISILGPALSKFGYTL